MNPDKLPGGGDRTVYDDLNFAKKTITDAAVDLIRGRTHEALMGLIDFISQDRGEKKALLF